MSESDIVVISEHQLYPAQHYKLGELNNEYNFLAKSSVSLNPALCGSRPGHGGIAILWRQSLSGVVTGLKDIGTDRIAVAEIAVSDNSNVYIVGVYLPQAGCPVEDFEYHASVLETTIEQCTLKGDVIVIGDLNAHLGPSETRARGWGTTSRNGKIMLAMCDNQGLVPVDMTSQAKGPRYTFLNERGHQSYIDHCLVAHYLLPSVTCCEVMEGILNTSDHLAIGLQLVLSESVSRTSTRTVKSSVAWHKVTSEQVNSLYTRPLDETIQALMGDTGSLPISREVLETKLTQLITLIKSQGAKLPSSQFNKHLKPYWNPGLSSLARENKAAWRKWVENGRPRDENNDVWNELKKTKREFRREQRRQESSYDNQYLEKIQGALEIDQKLFWSLINKRTKQRLPLVRPVVDQNGKIVRDTEGIASVWKDHFEQLYTPKDLPQFDSDTKRHVDETLNSIDMSPQDTDTVLLANPINQEEVEQACKSLKSGKAARVDGIQPEHLKHAGRTSVYSSST
jgi:exonuclease III